MIENNVLQIYSVPAKLDVSTVTPVLSSTYVKAKLDIEKTPSYIDMHSKNITCDIDSTACQAEEGHMTSRMLMEQYAQQGINNAQESTHDAAVVGQMLVNAGRGANIIQGVAKQEIMGEIPNTGIKFIPSQRPTINWSKNELYIDGHPEKDTYNWTTTTWPNTQLKRSGDVSVTETQKPEFHIEYTGDTNMLQTLDQRA